MGGRLTAPAQEQALVLEKERKPNKAKPNPTL